MSDTPNLEELSESLRAHGWTVNPDDWNGGHIAVNEGSPVHTRLTTDEAEAIVSARDGLGPAHGDEKARFWKLHDRCLPEGQQIFRLVDDEASTPPDDYVTYLEIREFRSCSTLDDLRALLEELGQTVE